MNDQVAPFLFDRPDRGAAFAAAAAIILDPDREMIAGQLDHRLHANALPGEQNYRQQQQSTEHVTGISDDTG
ncbi:hypothetical protein NX786_15020 [Telluria mixta]|uniref:Uncharacterized protein n=1 Tax=Telluria mixta TaxID=34071 RepID=A0ABT2C0B1_9BURK|nr:hypothetical protein [Telluria mixta]MCS0630647.1 hypothetical protein [Telluria mixta]WEM98653.1 hypothetical protein P0M04_13395 [Telluria mixta]